jgi:hypothetical protein
MTQTAHSELTTKEIARRLRLAVRGGQSLRAACHERGWKYPAVYARLKRAGLIQGLLAAKYEATDTTAGAAQ